MFKLAVALDQSMPAKNQPLQKPFLDFITYEKRYSPHTVLSYETDLRDFFDHIEITYSNLPLKEIQAGIIRGWLASLKEAGLSSRSINRKISSLRSFFKYQLKIGVIKSTPMSTIVSPKSGKRLPVFVKETEAKKLLEAVNTMTEDWKTLNAKMLLTLFYNTGMRLSELINLREDQVDKSRSQLKVLGKGNKERIIPVSKDVLQIITDYKEYNKKQFGKSDKILLVTERRNKMYPIYTYLLIHKYIS